MRLTVQVDLKRRFSQHPSIDVSAAVRLLLHPGKSPDETPAGLAAVRRLLGQHAPVAIAPPWEGGYQKGRRLFHVMPFGPGWAAEVMRITERACAEHDVTYVRDDRVLDDDIVPSIFREICQASYVLVDLTGFNGNVAFEAGLAHTLGRNTLLTTQGSHWSELFESVSKMRVHAYGLGDSEGEAFFGLLSDWLAGRQLRQR